MLAQGLFLPVSDALPALLYGTVGGLIQAAWAGCIWLGGDRAGDNESPLGLGPDPVPAARQPRPRLTERDETERRLVLRAVGTFLGLANRHRPGASIRRLRALDRNHPQPRHGALLRLITVQYALFTAAITTYVVLLSDTLGEAPLHAAWQRALGTVVGIAIAWLAFRIFPAQDEGR